MQYIVNLFEAIFIKAQVVTVPEFVNAAVTVSSSTGV